ncbi:hypothetical protein SNE40_013746 [Patella caerulea]|uniref:OTU domain-containing protein n=2 Tax=Patella caerulea TaxID=87958 RepID=A0AAN8PP86_PATCE
MPSKTQQKNKNTSNYLPNMTRNQALVNGHVPNQENGHNSGKQAERAMREAYRRERKMDSYLAEDENFPSFATQLGKLGLHLRDIPGDGNCLFRALGDQLEGHGRNHYKHRIEVTNYMLKERKDFEPFVEDDVPFETHITNLRRLGTYAGNDAIVAFARLECVNVMIHQLGNKPLLIQGSKNTKSRQLHIAYHNGDHYSSVRKMNDNTESPANIQLQDTEEKEKNVYSNGYSDHHGNKMAAAIRSIEDIEREVMVASGCTDLNQVKEILEDCEYDSDLAIANLLQIMDIGNEDTSSVASQRTSTDSGIWSESGTATRIFGDDHSRCQTQPIHFRDNSYGGSSGYGSISSNRSLGGAIPKKDIKQMSSKEKKELKKMEKKQRAEDRHRAKVLGQQQPKYIPQHNAPEIYTIKSNVTSSITRI